MPGFFRLTLKQQKKLQKLFSSVALFSLFLQIISGAFYYQPVIAEDGTETTPVVEQSTEVPTVFETTPSPENISSPEPTPSIEIPVEVTPTPVEEVMPASTIEEGIPMVEDETPPQETGPPLDLEKPIEDPVSAQIIPTPTPIEKVCLTEGQEIKDTTDEDWNINSEENWSQTKESVKLGVKYVFPQENKVSVTFKCLPKEGTTQLKIQKVKISDLKLPEGINPYGEWAYDITTSMQDGTFEYDVTLPKPENEAVEVSFMEDINSEAEVIEMGKINQEGDKVKVESLDHFTIFIPVLRTDVLKIMPLGDSITKGSGVCYAPDTYLNCTGYRIHLWNMLVENGFDDFDFVGSQGGSFQSQYTHDNDHEGHGGWTPAGIEGSIYGWLETYKPDIVLLHIGTNDLNNGDVEDILDKIDGYESDKSVDVDVILALIINRKNGGHTVTSNFNNAIETMALARITAGDKIKIVDMENGAGINYVTDMTDDKHPNDSGYQKMAAAWYNALTNESVDPSCPAGIQPISSITATGISDPNPIMLQSVTVGAGCYTINVDNLYTGTGSGTYTGGGSPTYPVINADNFNINSFASQFSPHDIVLFNGDLWVDTNGNNPDFFIFENGGTDTGTIAAIFPDGSFGNPISFNGSSHWGATGFTSSVGNQSIKGMAFAITDLLDGSGNNLTNDTIIKGLRIVSAGLDPSSASAVIVGESQLPCVNTVSGLGTITATGDAGVIQTITYGANTYAPSDLDLGLTKQYLADGTEVPLAWDPPGADGFSFNKNAHTTDSAIYLQTMFAEDHNTFFVFENGGNDDANWYGVKADGTLTSGFFVDASVVATATGYKSGFGGDLKGFVFKTCEDVRGIRIEDNPSTFGFDAQSISAIPLEDGPVPENVCPNDGDWDKVDDLDSQSHTYNAPSGKLVAETCYKAGTEVVYDDVNPDTSPVTVSSTVWNKDGCPDAAGCNYLDLSHASFRLVDAPQTGSVEVTKNVNWGSYNPDTNQSFDICVTNDSDTWTDCKDVDYDGGTVMWDLDPMTYSVYERDPGSNWVVSAGIPVDVSVTAGGNSTITITNTYNPVLRPLCEVPTIIDFDDLQTGELVTNQYNHFGLTISAENNDSSHPDKAIIFDSANPTGNDPDLVTPGYGPGNLLPQGKILIIAQDDLDLLPLDGFVDNPNDEAAGGIFYFNFATPIDINGIGLLDIEENGGEIRLYDEVDDLIDTIFIFGHGDNSYQSVNILESNVKRMEVEFVGSGAITHLSFCPSSQYCGDGLVNNEEQCDYGELNGQSTCSTSCEWVNACTPQMAVNGEFEIPNAVHALGWDIFDSAQVPGWTAEWYGGGGERPDPQIELHAGVNGWASPADQYVELDSDWDGPGGSINSEAASISLYQKIPTISGFEYKLSWSYSPRPNHNNNRLEVKINNNVVFDSGVVAGGSSINWINKSDSFIGDGGLATIRFTENGNPDSYGMFLDNVVVECLGEAKGSLEVTKVVDWDTVTPDNAKTFEICIEGPSFPGGNCQSADYNGEVLAWGDLKVGNYTITETDPGGNWLVTGSGQAVGVTSGNTASAEVKNEINPVTIKAHKIVCQSESDLPNWGDNASGSVNSTTAANFINNSGGRCVFEADWDFQWGFNDKSGAGGVDKMLGTHLGAANGTDSCVGTNCGFNINTGAGYGDWKNFDNSSDNPDPAEVVIDDLEGSSGIWVRENLKENYLPFSYPPSPSPGDNYSAEIYCHYDHYKYDNYDLIDSPQYGQTYYCVALNTLNVGDLTAHKFEDLNDNGVNDDEPSLEGWQMGIYAGYDCQGQVIIDGSKNTDSNGDALFLDLIVGPYSVNEIIQAGWQTTTRVCQNIDVLPNQNVTVEVGNFELGKIKVCKYDDYNGNGTLDEGEPGIDGVGINLETELVSDGDGIDGGKVLSLLGITGDDENDTGCYVFKGLRMGNYNVVENTDSTILTGYSPSDGTETSYPVSIITSGQEETVDFFNELQPISLELDKTHNKVGFTVARGETLNFTLTVENITDSTAYNVNVRDVLPAGFSYVLGTARVDGNLSEPTISDQQLTWNVGNMDPDQKIVVTYDVEVSDSQNEGGYPNVAVAFGTNRPAGSEDNSTSYSNFAYVYTAVGIGLSYAVSIGGGFVLGASIGPVGSVLGAATGSPTFVLIMAILMILAGLAILLKKGKKFHV